MEANMDGNKDQSTLLKRLGLQDVDTSKIPAWLLEKARTNPGLAADLRMSTAAPQVTPYWDFEATRPMGAPNPNHESLLTAVARALAIDKFVSNAAWSFTHPLDRLFGRGRAANQQMAFPGVAGKWVVNAAERQFVNDVLGPGMTEGPARLPSFPQRAGKVNASRMGLEGPLGPGASVPVESASGALGLIGPRIPLVVKQEIGPRRIGGVYRTPMEKYRVLDIKIDPATQTWRIFVESTKDSPNQFGRRWHATSWDPKTDKVLE